MEKLLERIFKSDYRDSIILKGGVLMIMILGWKTRVTRDVDSTLENMDFNERELRKNLKKL